MNEGTNKKLALTAMIFAVSMTFIDQTIVSIAAPVVQKDLGLSETGLQWIVNGYLLALAALFAFGGRIADIRGHKQMVLIGIGIFATASALCGATPDGSIAEAWIITFRIIQGAGAAIMFPAALAIVVSAYDRSERGKALALFFGIAGGMTALGPFAGGFLIDITWRTIFWINIPVAIAAVILTLKAKPDNVKRPAPLDIRGTALVLLGIGLLVLGLQQSSAWGWDDPKTWIAIALGVVLLALFVRVELRTDEPLIQMRIFRNQGFRADAAILFAMSIAFVPMFLYASLYSQISLGYDSSNAGLYIGVFFAGFVVASQWGGRMLDKMGAKPPVTIGCAVSAVGFALWANSMPDLDFNSQWYYIVTAGAGMGLAFGPINTDALNRAPGTSYGEITGITQTVRNIAATLAIAVLGTLLISQNRSNIEDSLEGFNIPTAKADEIAESLSRSSGGEPPSTASETAKDKKIFAVVQGDFAKSSEVLFYVMAGGMAVGFVLAATRLPAGKVEETVVDDSDAPTPRGAA